MYSGKRKVVFLPDLSLDFVKALKQHHLPQPNRSILHHRYRGVFISCCRDPVALLRTAANATLNDVLMGAFAGAVRRYSLEQEATFSGGAPSADPGHTPVVAKQSSNRVRDYSRLVLYLRVL